jgi:hypothetical protein
MTRSSSDVVSFLRGMGSSIDPCRAIQSPRFGAGSNPPAGIRAVHLKAILVPPGALRVDARKIESATGLINVHRVRSAEQSYRSGLLSK